jgi:hypothetical protein
LCMCVMRMQALVWEHRTSHHRASISRACRVARHLQLVHAAEAHGAVEHIQNCVRVQVVLLWGATLLAAGTCPG